MRSDVVTLGSVCDIHGCQRVAIKHEAGGRMEFGVSLKNNRDIDVTTKDLTKPISVATDVKNPQVVTTARLVNNKGLDVSFGLVCTTGNGKWEFLMVKEGVIMLIDGQCVLVRR